ncbi:membrane protein, putative [Fructilactobacillus florum 8D]|uniref:Membrane protein, putative n=2 Tax=Fructilactobacillus florum TaxID=640331 RepID=W9EGM8_9LACO|nr:Bax inhibitor-1/YccA family protein [Fructilactobacillus florum]EKK20694.1 membrane protein, putative [Fructilactobacillus florum 2F]ETO40160.1 membrane protein, putative [Fructilactobacillus florum 8D]
MNGEMFGNTAELAQRLVAKTYQKVCGGLVVTGIVMLLMSTFMRSFVTSMGLGSSLLILLVALGLMLALGHSVNDEKTSASTTNTIYYLMTVLFGVSLSPILIYYRMDTIGLAFLGTAVMFGGLTFYANRTTKDYLRFSSYLTWGLLAAIVLSVVAVLLRIPTLYIIIDVVMLVIFAVFIVMDTQSVRKYAEYVDSETKLQKFSTIGALNIYLDILNIFQILVQLLGMSNDNN